MADGGARAPSEREAQPLAVWSLRLTGLSAFSFFIEVGGLFAAVPRAFGVACLGITALGFLVALLLGLCGGLLAFSRNQRGVGAALVSVVISGGAVLLTALAVVWAVHFSLAA